MANRTVNTIVGEKSSFKGSLNVQNSVEIRGKFEGNIKTKEDILIRKSGRVKTNIRARNILVEGFLDGNIEATSSVVINNEAQVKGDIRSPNLKIEQGAKTFGKIAIDEVPEKEEKN